MYYKVAQPGTGLNEAGGTKYEYRTALYTSENAVRMVLRAWGNSLLLVFAASTVERLEREIDFYNQGALVCAIAGTSLMHGVSFGEEEILQREAMLNQTRYAYQTDPKFTVEDGRRMEWVKWMIERGKFSEEIPT